MDSPQNVFWAYFYTNVAIIWLVRSIIFYIIYYSHFNETSIFLRQGTNLCVIPANISPRLLLQILISNVIAVY